MCCTATTPDAFESVNCVPDTLLCNVTKAPSTPEAVNSETVWVVLAGNIIVAGCAVLVMLLKVFEPVMVNAPVPPWFKFQYVSPPPTNVLALVLVKDIVDVPALKVRLVVVVASHAVVVAPVIETVLDPSVKVLATVVDKSNVVAVTLKPLVLKVPWFRLNAAQEKASARETVIPAAFTIIS